MPGTATYSSRRAATRGANPRDAPDAARPATSIVENSRLLIAGRQEVIVNSTCEPKVRGSSRRQVNVEVRRGQRDGRSARNDRRSIPPGVREKAGHDAC